MTRFLLLCMLALSASTSFSATPKTTPHVRIEPPLQITQRRKIPGGVNIGARFIEIDDDKIPYFFNITGQRVQSLHNDISIVHISDNDFALIKRSGSNNKIQWIKVIQDGVVSRIDLRRGKNEQENVAKTDPRRHPHADTDGEKRSCGVGISYTRRFRLNYNSDAETRSVINSVMLVVNHLLRDLISDYGFMFNETYISEWPLDSQPPDIEELLDQMQIYGPKETCTNLLFDSDGYDEYAGVAYIGRACAPPYNKMVAASSNYATLLIVVAHEYGHQCGILHQNTPTIMNAVASWSHDYIFNSRVRSSMTAFSEEVADSCYVRDEPNDKPEIPRTADTGGGLSDVEVGLIAGGGVIFVGSCAVAFLYISHAQKNKNKNKK